MFKWINKIGEINRFVLNSLSNRLFHKTLNMKLISATLTLLLSTSLADETLKCYGSDGWKNLESVKFEKEPCSYSRCYAATSKDFFIRDHPYIMPAKDWEGGSRKLPVLLALPADFFDFFLVTFEQKTKDYADFLP